MVYVDLLTASQQAVYAALAPLAGRADLPTSLQIFSHVPQDVKTPYVLIGDVDTDNNSGYPGEQEEEISIEIISVFRGTSRAPLLAIMHAVRLALHNQPITAPSAAFETPNYLKGSAGSAASADGVTQLGIQTFKFIAQPA